MKILILGGTIFLGRHLVEAALARGHEITLFNRGEHAPDLYPQVEQLRGDRRRDLAVLQGRKWDAVIDTSGYVPSSVSSSAQRLAGAVGQYVFISSISVYADVSMAGMDESAPVSPITPEQLRSVEEISLPAKGVTAQAYGELYGGLKALCEQAVEEQLPGRALNIRPGLIVGPYDYSDRFTYWPVRFARGGEVLVPDRPERLVQLIDVRDLAAWTIHMVETGQMGTYNATGPAQALTMGEVLSACQSVSESDSTFTWINEAFLLAEKVQPWSQLPLWLPDEPENAGFHAISIAKALAAGLAFRPLTETAAATLAWNRLRPADHEWRAGLAAADEARLLKAWHERA
ncbi:MAG TPA: NAD-dependent epimerase/dehydratase family protein [Ktedonobacteraceae bacterium]